MINRVSVNINNLIKLTFESEVKVMKPLPAKYMEVVNDNFWELL